MSHILRFKPLGESDLPLMLEWLSREHIKQWWDDGEETLEQVAEHYGTPEEGLERFVLLYGEAERPIGYFQYYTCDDGSIGIDQFIGEEDLTNQGVGTAAVSSFVKMIWERLDPPYIVLDPEPENTRAIRCYQKAGFKHYATRPGYDGKPAYMMSIDRPA